MGRARKGVKITYVYPIKTMKSVEDEAIKRILENTSSTGKKLKGSVARDIFLIALQLSFKDIKKMSITEFNKRCKEVHR